MDSPPAARNLSVRDARCGQLRDAQLRRRQFIRRPAPRPNHVKLVAGPLRPRHRAQSLEDRSGLGEGACRRSPLLCSTMEAALSQPRPTELEGQPCSCVEVERLECLEGTAKVSFCRQDNRLRPRQCHIDPGTREGPAPVLQPDQRFPGAVELAELDQQLGVERLRAIEKAVPHADLIKQPPHLRQRVVGCAIVARREFHEPEHAQQHRRPPRLLLLRGLGDEREKRLPCTVEPSAIGVHQRAPGKRVGKSAAHLEPLLDRVAALLDQPLREVAATSVKLDQGQIAETF
jgi:hypothetical protein